MTTIPQTLFGMRIQISPDVPKMTLSKDVPVSPEFRVEIDKWMLGFFGTTNIVPDGQALVMHHMNCVVMNERMYLQVRAATA